jgi:opacity protein-like surface antigen
MKRIYLILALAGCCYTPVLAQPDDLEAQLLGEMGATTDYAVSIFLSENIVNGQSTVLRERNNLAVRFKHHFDPLKVGADEAFGFNRASVYAEVGYAPADWMNIAMGYGTHNHSLNGSAKLRVLRQSTGKVFMPVNLSLFGAVNYRTLRYGMAALNDNFVGRLDYVAQALISRRMGSLISLQLAPTFVHRNLTERHADPNNLFALGAGASVRLRSNLRLNLEYYSLTTKQYDDPVAVGVSYQTSRHSFELFLTNAQLIEENYFLSSSSGSFFKGNIRVGFNIAINFTLSKH